MVNGASGSAWASLAVVAGTEEVVLLGTPADGDPRPVTGEHLFDLASLTKVFTTVVALRLMEEGRIDPDAPVAEVMPVGRGTDAERITLRHLLTHTSGLPAECALWRTGMRGDALAEAAMRSRLLSSPGAVHRYSDVGFVAVGRLVELVAGRPLADLVRTTAGLLGARALTYAPDPGRAVATEVQPERGMVRGGVHDELAFALGGPAGHAGLFGTLGDVAALAAMIRDGGAGAHGRVLSSRSVATMTTPVVPAEAGWGQAIGLRVRDRLWMGDVDAVGHTGFTGTCFAVTRDGNLGVLLTNRVHPTRTGEVNDARRRFVATLASERAQSPGGPVSGTATQM